MSHLIKICAVCKFSYFCFWFLKELNHAGFNVGVRLRQVGPGWGGTVGLSRC